MNEQDKQMMIELYRTMNKAMVNADISTLETILTDDYTLTHITGYEQSRAEWLGHIRTGKMDYFSTQEVNINVQDTQLIGRAITAANIWGINGSWNLRLTISMEKQNGKWLMKKAVATTF